MHVYAHLFCPISAWFLFFVQPLFRLLDMSDEIFKFKLKKS
jgi:hypothetical protein